MADEYTIDWIVQAPWNLSVAATKKGTTLKHAVRSIIDQQNQNFEGHCYHLWSSDGVIIAVAPKYHNLLVDYYRVAAAADTGLGPDMSYRNLSFEEVMGVSVERMNKRVREVAQALKNETDLPVLVMTSRGEFNGFEWTGEYMP